MSELISIIVPTYKRSKIIKSAIKCIESQTYNPIEIIVVDDNGISTNEQKNTNREVESLNSSKVIKYFALERNMGAAYARNFGVAKCSGDYISFFDDDDLWHDQKLMLQYDLLQSNPDLGFVYCWQSTYESVSNKLLSGPKQDFGRGYIFQKLIKLENGSIATPNPLIRKAAFNEVGGFDVNLPALQDIDLFLRIARKYPVDFIPRVMHKVFIHSGDRITTNHNSKLTAYNIFLSKHLEALELSTKCFLNQRIIRHSFWVGNLKTAVWAYRYLKSHCSVSVIYRLLYWGVKFKTIGQGIKVIYWVKDFVPKLIRK